MKKLFVIFLLFSCVAGGMSAQSENSIRQRINQVASQMQTMQCDFVQTKYLKMLNDKMVSTGKMYYQQNNKLRWEYLSPYKYTFILNGTNVMLKKNNRHNVIDVKQNKVFKEITRIMMNSVVGKCLSDKKDFKTSIAVAPSEWVVTMIPLKKDMKQMFQKIILHFNKQHSMVSRVDMIEKNGDKTFINLNNVQINKSVNAKMFSLN